MLQRNSKSTSVKLKLRASTVPGYPGKLYFQIIHDRVTRQIGTDYRIFSHEWDAESMELLPVEDPVRNAEIIRLRQRIEDDWHRMQVILADMDRKGYDYATDRIVSEFVKRRKVDSLYSFAESVVTHLRQLGKDRTAETYEAAIASFRAFRHGDDIMLDNITSETIQLYEAYLKRRGLCPNTTSFYMRILRAIYNRGVERGLAVQRYPFRHVYTGISKTVKRAIPVADVRRIRQLDLSRRPALAVARDIFLFSFYTRGMAFVDIAFLRKTDIRDGVISYRRHKTGQQLHIKIEQCIEEIIKRYENSKSPYVMPIIVSEGNEYAQYKNALRSVNSRLKTIGNMISSPVKLTTYVGRHSWGSAAKRNNIPLSVISESMGHDKESTTQIYLASLDTAIIDEANAKILRALNI